MINFSSSLKKYWKEIYAVYLDEEKEKKYCFEDYGKMVAVFINLN